MKLRTFLAAMVISLAMLPMLNSCTTKQSAINQMERLAYDIRDNGSYYTLKDWEDAAQTFMNIRNKMSKFKYTPAERRRIGELEGECARYMKEGIKNGAINGIMGVAGELRGILEGLGIGGF